MATKPEQEQQQEPRAHYPGRTLKWVIYPLLALNIWFYLDDEFLRVFQIYMSGSNLFDWIIEFVSSIETLAYFILIVMLELQTHAAPTRNWSGWKVTANRVTRAGCYALIALTLAAYAASLADYYRYVGQPGVDSLCELANQDVSFVYNLEYTKISESNCAGLSDETEFFYLGEEAIVTTEAGLSLERLLGWMDVFDAVAWILLLVTIERVIYLQKRGEVAGRKMKPIYVVKTVLYTTMFLFAAMWAFLSHWLYTWDAVIWIAAFLIIEMNVNQWRDEIKDELGLVPI